MALTCNHSLSLAGLVPSPLPAFPRCSPLTTPGVRVGLSQPSLWLVCSCGQLCCTHWCKGAVCLGLGLGRQGRLARQLATLPMPCCCASVPAGQAQLAPPANPSLPTCSGDGQERQPPPRGTAVGWTACSNTGRGGTLKKGAGLIGIPWEFS